MKPEDYNRLHDLLWQRIMHLGLKKIDYETIRESFMDIGEETGYNIVALIIERLAKEDIPLIAAHYVRNSLLQAGYFTEENTFLELANEINEKNQDEILAVQTLYEMIDNKESWETTCMAVEIVLLPDEY